ncbi:hypothetical protein ABDD95_18850 [Mucilaginibacter sp. PAMB04274]|uniref:hypothetical protein n=1 Tax=Mucilaginibacter sp. PAMB04274 TaxID=3138568 RepID=UPI0031F6BDC1
MVQIGSSGEIEFCAVQLDYLAATAARDNLTISLARKLKGIIGVNLKLPISKD